MVLHGEEGFVWIVVVEDDEMPVFFSEFSIFMDVEDFDFFIIYPFAMGAQSLFKVLYIGVVEVIVIAIFGFIVGKSYKAILYI